MQFVKNVNLVAVAIVYAAAPLLIFLFFWFRFPFNMLFLLMAVWGLVSAFEEAKKDRDDRERLNSATVIGVIVLASILCLLAGVGGYFPQCSDYSKHNALFGELARGHWPVSYFYKDGTLITLVCYFGYHLVPSLVGKFFGFELLQVASLVWAATGVSLGGLLWLKYFRLPLWGFGLLLGFCGLDFVGYLLTHYNLPELGTHLEWWLGGKMQYHFLFAQTNWAPQHGVAGILFTPLLLLALEKRRISLAVASICVAFFWSPFVAIGLIPFVLIGLWGKGAKDIFGFQHLSAILGILFPVAVFYLCKKFPEKLTLMSGPWLFGDLGIFYLAEIIPWLFLIRRQFFSNPVVVSAIVCLFLIPLGHLGNFNDWVTRVSIPATLCLAGFVIGSLKTSNLCHKLIFAGVYFVGAISPVYELYASIKQHVPFSPECRIGSFSFMHRMDYVSHQYFGEPCNHFPASSLLAGDPRFAQKRPLSWRLSDLITQWTGMESIASANENDSSCLCTQDCAIVFQNPDNHSYFLRFAARLEGYNGSFPEVQIISPNHASHKLKITREGIAVSGVIEIPQGNSALRFVCEGIREKHRQKEEATFLYGLSSIVLAEERG